MWREVLHRKQVVVTRCPCVLDAMRINPTLLIQHR